MSTSLSAPTLRQTVVTMFRVKCSLIQAVWSRQLDIDSQAFTSLGYSWGRLGSVERVYGKPMWSVMCENS